MFYPMMFNFSHFLFPFFFFSSSSQLSLIAVLIHLGQPPPSQPHHGTKEEFGRFFWRSRRILLSVSWKIWIEATVRLADDVIFCFGVRWSDYLLALLSQCLCGWQTLWFASLYNNKTAVLMFSLLFSFSLFMAIKYHRMSNRVCFNPQETV